MELPSSFCSSIVGNSSYTYYYYWAKYLNLSGISDKQESHFLLNGFSMLQISQVHLDSIIRGTDPKIVFAESFEPTDEFKADFFADLTLLGLVYTLKLLP